MRKNLHRFLTEKKGFTLMEVITTLAVTSMITVLCLSAVSFLNVFTAKVADPSSADSQFRSIHVFLQKQIETSDTIRIHNGQVYLRDMESSQYYNHYGYIQKVLYRYKSDNALIDIGPGDKSQLGISLDSFVLEAVTASGTPTGDIHLAIRFSNNTKTYETTIHYPGSPQNIQIQ